MAEALARISQIDGLGMIQIRADLSVPSLSVSLTVGFGLEPLFFASTAFSEATSVFIRLAPMARPLLARSEASDRVPPMQISASGRVSCARYSPEVVSQPGRRTCQ